MRFATSSVRLSAEFDPFGDEVLAEIIQTVIAAWGRMRRFTQQEIARKWGSKKRKKKGPCPVQPIENWITHRLAGRIRNDEHFRSIPFDVVPQYPLVDMDGNELGRIDLYFKHRHSQTDYFAFEAKRLHVTYPGGTKSDEYATYAGIEGMEAYLLGQYSAGLPAAGMLGYVMDGRTADAESGLHAAILKKRAALNMSVDTPPFSSALLPASTHNTSPYGLFETIHGLKDRLLRIFHLLLPY